MISVAMMTCLPVVFSVVDPCWVKFTREVLLSMGGATAAQASQPQWRRVSLCAWVINLLSRYAYNSTPITKTVSFLAHCLCPGCSTPSSCLHCIPLRCCLRSELNSHFTSFFASNFEAVKFRSARGSYTWKVLQDATFGHGATPALCASAFHIILASCRLLFAMCIGSCFASLHVVHLSGVACIHVLLLPPWVASGCSHGCCCNINMHMRD
jgi:hypothetical protein